MKKSKDTSKTENTPVTPKQVMNPAPQTSVYQNILEGFLKAFRVLSSFVDRIFFSSKYVSLFALILAVLLYAVVNISSNDIAGNLSSAKTVSGVPVNVTYATETFEVTGVPESCSVTITGDAANVNAAASRSGACVLNLEGLTEGSHYVSVKASGFGDNVSLVANPSQALVTLSKKTTKAFALSYDYINQDKLDSRYILGVPEFLTGTTDIYIRASEDTLNSISLVKALIDVTGQAGDFEIEAPLVAYNSKGQLVNAEISPSKVKVRVGVSSPHKSVPITLVLSGETSLGFSVETIRLDHQSTEIYASEAVLSSISDVKVSLDLSTILGDSDLVLPIELPQGVNSSEFSSVNASVVLAPTVAVDYPNLSINYENNNNNLSPISFEPSTINAVATGTQSNIDSLSENDFQIYVNFDGLTPGEYDLPLYVKWTKANTYIDVQLDVQTIHIVLVNRN